MGISSFQEVINPKQPQTAYISGSTLISTGVYTTVLNITSGKGIVSKIVFALANAGYVYQANTNLIVSVTVDGGVSSFLIASSLGTAYFENSLRGYDRALGYTTGSNVIFSNFATEYTQPVYFSKSLRVEVAHVLATSARVYGYVDYSTV